MKIRKVLIDDIAQQKILEHGLKREEVENALLEGNPKFSKDRYGRYLALTCHDRYITIVFEYTNFNADIITAYKSSDWQIRRCKRK